MLKSIRFRTKYFVCIVAIILVAILFISFPKRDNSLLNDNYNNLPDEQELEPYYNLTAVDTDGDGNPDKNYTTPIKNQELGICWSYAIMETAETHIMVTNNETYQEGKTRILSPRQLDYLNTFMINGYKNPYGTASFSNGGEFKMINHVLATGLSFVDSSWETKNSVTASSQNNLEYVDVFNISNSLYELDSTIEIPNIKISELDLSKQEDITKFNNHVNTIKRFIKSYGGPYIGTINPSGSCSSKNYYDNSQTVVGINTECMASGPGGHAMQIIGWDDDYRYKYCKGAHNNIDFDSCGDNIVDGQGAWILRNSWGEYMPYAYLPYDTDIDDVTNIVFISKLSLISNKQWNYIIDSYYSVGNPFSQKIIDFKDKFDLNAKLVKVKFKNVKQNGKFKVYISQNGSDNYSLIKDLTVDYPGYVTINVSDSNYIVNNNSLVKIVSENEAIGANLYAFIKENSNNGYIITSNYNINEATEEESYKKIYIYSDTYNIESSETISYKIYNDNDEDITNQTSVKYNTVGFNGVNALLYLPKDYNGAYYTLKTYYNDDLKSTSKIVINGNGLKGLGTSEEPYIISTADDLYAIGDFLDAHYVLENDIDLTNDSRNRKGWEPLGKRKSQSFTGTLDGKNHKIIGLNIEGNGLFYAMGAEGKESCIKNIIFENAKINEYALLVGYILSPSNASIEISNIAVINSTFERNTQLIAFRLNVDGGSLKIKNIFSNSTVNDNLYSLVDAVESFNSEDFIIENIQILSKFNMIDNEDDLFRSTPLFIQGSGNVKLRNMIFNNYVNLKTNLFYDIYNDEENKPQFKNIFYLGEATNPQPQFCTNVESKTLNGLKDKNNYSNWNDFDDNWIIKEIDGIKRIPVLKFVPFEYTSISDIALSENSEINIYDYLTPKIDAAKNISYQIADDKVASIDQNGNIKGLMSGETTIHVISYYDGFEKDVKITVNKKIDACYMDQNGAYTWGEYSADSNYTLVKSITKKAQCTSDVFVPKTGISISNVIYIFIAILLVFGVGLICYSSITKKIN